MEWDFVEYLLEAIKIHDLSHVDVPVGSNKSGGSNKKMDTWCGPKPKSNSHSIKSNGSIDGCFQVNCHVVPLGLRTRIIYSNLDQT